MVLRTRTHTYVHRRHGDDECYDRIADPDETTNLLASTDANGAIQRTASDLGRELFGWLADTSDVIGWDANPRFPSIPHGFR